LKALVRSAIGKADDLADRLLETLRARLGRDDDATIIPYLGHAGEHGAYLSGRVLRRPPLVSAAADDSKWRNLRNVYTSFATREVPHARIRALFAGACAETTADKEGYFRMEVPRKSLRSHAQVRAEQVPDEHVWQSAALELVHPVARNPANAHATTSVLTPPTRARYAVVSDIDDTVVATNVTSKVKMALTVLLSNAHTRMPFAGLSAFYRALRDGITGNEDNPFFYVSNGPWNLYALVLEFLRLNDIPLGPLFLRDFGDELLFAPSADGAHKLACIDRLVETYPELPFILIGDSGERDPEIYGEIVTRHPERIRVIYIRSIDRSPKRIDALEKLVGRVSATRTQFVLVPDSEFAAVHAASENLIRADALAAIRLDAGR
jgi:phosphatidate phosphatase APP1